MDQEIVDLTIMQLYETAGGILLVLCIALILMLWFITIAMAYLDYKRKHDCRDDWERWMRQQAINKIERERGQDEL